MRVKLLLALLLLVGAVSSLQAQMLPVGMVDSSLRMELLFGRQSVRYTSPPDSITTSGSPFPELVLFGVHFDSRVPLLAGNVEVSPFPSLSGRLAGALSIWETPGTRNRDTGEAGGTPPGGLWKSIPHFGYWEVAGLYHLWAGDGYRFSLTAGYRQEKWEYRGDPIGLDHTDVSLRDDISSYIPFLGLQTAMVFPWWKARFEVMGSPFMTKTFSSKLHQSPTSFIDHNAKGNKGGLLEFQMEGSVSVTSTLWLGLHGRYAYQEVYGTSTRNANGTVSSFDAYFAENLTTVGLDLTLLF